MDKADETGRTPDNEFTDGKLFDRVFAEGMALVE